MGSIEIEFTAHNPVEERSLAERGARTFRVEHLLASAERDLPDLDAALGHDEEAPARFAFLKEGLSPNEASRHTPSGQATQLAGRQGNEVRDSPKGVDARQVGLCPRHAHAEDHARCPDDAGRSPPAQGATTLQYASRGSGSRRASPSP